MEANCKGAYRGTAAQERGKIGTQEQGAKMFAYLQRLREGLERKECVVSLFNLSIPTTASLWAKGVSYHLEK